MNLHQIIQKVDHPNNHFYEKIKENFIYLNQHQISLMPGPDKSKLKVNTIYYVLYYIICT